MKRFTLIFLAITFCILLDACAYYECSRFKKIASSRQELAIILDWADNKIFSRAFDRDDFSGSGIVGPGKYSLRRSPEFYAPKAIFYDFESLSVRLLGQDESSPVGVFIGTRSFEGIVIAKMSLDDLQQRAKLTFDASQVFDKRVAVICRSD
jgi:hypothetical protein